MYEDDLGFIFRRRKDTKYKQEEKALARGDVDSWNNQTAFGACGGSPPAP